ncbi:hypothetical protein QUF70_05795 [Desulfobacterales bacterium HSG17]|nr:hypothetical protein [Desulfobacterales bacterium HSG17]
MDNIQIAIEGTASLEAAKDLIETCEISGDWQTPDGAMKGALATIATIVGIVGGTVAVSEQIRKWYQEWKKGKSGRAIEKAVLVGNGKRVLLEGASADDIKAVLETL